MLPVAVRLVNLDADTWHRGDLDTARCLGRNGLFDHLVGAREKRWRHLQTERLGGLEAQRHRPPQ
jgi:hypothetical protein